MDYILDKQYSLPEDYSSGVAIDAVYDPDSATITDAPSTKAPNSRKRKHKQRRLSKADIDDNPFRCVNKNMQDPYYANCARINTGGKIKRTRSQHTMPPQ